MEHPGGCTVIVNSASPHHRQRIDQAFTFQAKILGQDQLQRTSRGDGLEMGQLANISGKEAVKAFQKAGWIRMG
jgi:hypothetical protein